MRLSLQRHIIFVALMALLSLSSCHSKRKTVRGDQGRIRTEQISERQEAKPKGRAADIISEGKKWLGTPYRYGGQDRKGMDCSGFVQLVYDRAAGIKLPRSSKDMAAAVRRVNKKDLRPADLVFFVNAKGGSRINHVAIYIGNGRILHSTTSRGVIESTLDDGGYWQSHYYCCGRVL